MRFGRTIGLGAGVAAAVFVSGCGGGTGGTAPAAVGFAAPPASGGRIEVKDLAGRPRLTLVTREGDPVGAAVVTVVTDLGPVATTALAAVVEARLKAAGLEVDTRVTREAFRVRLATKEVGRVDALWRAAAAAFAKPIAAGAPEVALARQRLESLHRNPLDAPELAPVAACTGALGVVASDPLPDLSATAGAQELERWRGSALNGARASLAVVGPAELTNASLAALGRGPDWPKGARAEPATDARDATGVYIAAGRERRGARITIAAYVGDPAIAAVAAEALGRRDGALAARVATLAEPWRLVEVTGSARPRGGCVSVELEAERRTQGTPLESSAALATATARKEMELAVARASGSGAATREILSAHDPREAAARAAWWALAEPSKAAPAWVVALGAPAADRGAAVDGARFKQQLERSVTAARAAVVERRVAVERGQGELWLLLASPCGVAEEGQRDAGSGAIAAIASVEARRETGDVALEPWVTSDGIGVLAHAAPRDDKETPVDLARRVGDAAARALVASEVTNDAAATARSVLLDRIERVDGRQGAAFEALAGALVPDHPSWIEPFGVWSRVASGGLEHIRLRAQAIAAGPLRVAVLANVDATQGAAAADAVDRWLSPSLGDRVCHAASSAPARSGQLEARLPSDASLSQALVAVPIAGDGRPYAELAAAVLAGDSGPLSQALRESASSSSARVVGGSRSSALVVEVRAPGDAIGSVTAQAKFVLTHLGQSLVDADLARAAAALSRRDVDARLDPHTRAADLWSGAAAPKRDVSASALKQWLGSWVREGSLLIVEAHPD